MPRLHLDQDIHPLSEFRNNVASIIHQVRKTHRPVVITQHGKSAVVLLDVTEYEDLLDKLELIQDVREAEEQLSRGEGIAHEKARKTILRNIEK